MIDIIIPMAGAGSRFADEGYKDPKPLIKVHGVPMIQLVIENLRPLVDHRFIFICQKEHVARYDLADKLKSWASGAIVVEIDGLTDGAACTVLKARDHIDHDRPLMIANSDQYVDLSMDDYLETMEKGSLDGLIMTMMANDPKWSFVGLSPKGLVERVVEKEVISNEATVGIYNFARGRDFVSAVDTMIAKDLRVNGEFYVAPAYNELIGSGSKIGIYNVGSDGDGMYGLGIPADLRAFLENPVSRTATGRD